MKAELLPGIGEVVGPSAGARGWLDDGTLRQRAGGALATGLTRELWKYTPIKAFLEALAEIAGGPPAVLGNADQPGLRAVPFNSLSAEDEARVQRLLAERADPARHPVADLALLKAQNGWYVEVTGQPAKPLEIHRPAAGVSPVLLVLAPNASLTVVEHVRQQGFLADVLHAELAPGAHLTHDRAALTAGVGHYSALSVHVGRDAGYRLNQSAVGGARRRLEVHVALQDEGAEAEMAGAYLVEDSQHLDQQLLVEHRAGHTTSRQRFHGIGAGKGRSVFNGRIHIHPRAPASDAALTNRNLALSPDAEMNTKPELEIYTDDVRCSHGATVGQISAEALFYLTTRGIPAAEARRLLAHGFVRECLTGSLADAALERLLEALE